MRLQLVLYVRVRCSSVQDGAHAVPPTSFRRIVPGPLLFSTNPYVKHQIQLKYRKDKHHVWCSEIFDATKTGAYSAG